MSRNDISRAGSGPQQIAAIGMTLASSAMIATVPIFAKLAYNSGASILVVVLGRTAIAAVLLAFVLIVLRQSFKASNRTLVLCVIGGIASALTSVGFLGSVASIDVSLAMLIVYMHPVIIAFIGRIRGTYKFGLIRILYCILIVFGLALALSVKLTDLAPSGIALACLGAVSLSVLLIVSGEAVSEATPIVVTFYTTLISFGVICIASLFVGTVAMPETLLGWAGFFGAGSFYCFGLAFFVAAVRYIDVARASLIGLIEPLIAIFLAMLLFHQYLSSLQWLGVGIVLLGLALLELPPAVLARILGR
jgi:drug/metabolite transporter (DMT)-like permease